MKLATGLVWIVVGVLLWLGGLAVGTPLYLRGTRVPWGLVVAGVGVVLAAVATYRSRRAGKDPGSSGN